MLYISPVLFSVSYVYWTVHHCDSWRTKDQLDVTCYFISLLMCSTYFGYILMSETCWTHKKWNKIASNMKLVFYSSTTLCYLVTLTVGSIKHMIYRPQYSIFPSCSCSRPLAPFTGFSTPLASTHFLSGWRHFDICIKTGKIIMLRILILKLLGTKREEFWSEGLRELLGIGLFLSS